MKLHDRPGDMISSAEGFSLVELVVSMMITLVILGAAVAAFTGALQSRELQSSRTDALSSAQAAINIMTREIGNSGYGLRRGQYASNGLVLGGDSTSTRIHVRANVNNANSTTSDPAEDITFYFDALTKSVVRYDAGSNTTSGIINRVSNVQFTYHNYAADGTSTTGAAAEETGRVTIRLTVIMAGDDEDDYTNARNVVFESDVTLRNSPYGMGQY